MNGQFEERAYGRILLFQGGPYRQRTPGSYGIKLATEISAPYDANVPCKDFQPFRRDDLEAAVEAAIKAAMTGKTVYAGCMGGIGRTGTFLACVMKVFHPDHEPVAMVRKRYYSHAVETDKQLALIVDFNPQPIRRKLFWWAVKAWFRQPL